MPLKFPEPIFYGTNRLHTAPQSPHRRLPRPTVLAIGTLNIWYRRGFGLVQDIRSVERGVFDSMILKELKIQSEV